jgi:hypothetical protein
MDRRAALDMLELVRPDADDIQHPEFQATLAYLETDEQARQAFAHVQRQDRQIAQAMSEVPIPDGLKARLNSFLANQTEDKSTYAEPLARPAAKTRRWMLSASVVVASGLLAALGVWFFGEKPQALLSLQELEAEALYEAADLAKLRDFSGEFEPVRPNDDRWMSDTRFAFSSPAKGFSPSPDGSDRVAVYEFFFRDPQGREPGELRGVMLVVPKSELREQPESVSFFEGAYTTHQAKPHVAIRSWSEGDLVYVCLVPIQHFEALNRVFDGTIG